MAFCLPDGTETVPWCNNIPPSIYTYAQAKYWNVGFLRYWTPSQLPNILLALPVLGLLLTFSFYYLGAFFTSVPLAYMSKLPHSSPPFFDTSLMPYVLHTILLSFVLLFASHTQIALRVAPCLPTTYWAAAWLLVTYPRIGRVWVMWSVLWGTLSVVLWGVFLPPA